MTTKGPLSGEAAPNGVTDFVGSTSAGETAIPGELGLTVTMGGVASGEGTPVLLQATKNKLSKSATQSRCIVILPVWKG
jgi:hypothetical protein